MHLDGVPFRCISNQTGLSLGATYREYESELSKLPDNNLLTMKYCNRWSGILVFDGKYVKVKGYDRKIVLLWGIDYLTHDIPIFVLAPNENYQACKKYFKLLQECNYPIQILVCDDNEAIKRAAKDVWYKLRIQTCTNHYLENIRKALRVRTDEKYKPFIMDLKNALFKQKFHIHAFNKRLSKLYNKYLNDDICVHYLVQIEKDKQELFNANYIKKAPSTTNIIESYNSHLQGRLKSLKGFESYKSAIEWINGYILRRRFKPFTDCRGKFRKLNKQTSISQTLRIGQKLPKIF